MSSSNEDGELRLLKLCTQESWWRVPHLVRLNLLLLVPFFASYVGGFDGSMLNGIQTVAQWQEGESLRIYTCRDPPHRPSFLTLRPSRRL